MAKRYIKLYEQITNWEWFQHPNTLAMFIYLLLKANYKDLNYQGRKIHRGQLVTSLPKLATGVGLSIRQTRTALEHLKSTGEVTDESTSQYRIITIVKYDQYQSSTDEATGNRQAIDRQVDRQSTDEATPSIEYIEYIENNNNKQSSSSFRPPTVEEVKAYQDELQSWWFDAERFVDYYASQGWRLKSGQPMKNWKAAVRLWNSKEREKTKSNKGSDDLPY